MTMPFLKCMTPIKANSFGHVLINKNKHPMKRSLSEHDLPNELSMEQLANISSALKSPSLQPTEFLSILLTIHNTPITITPTNGYIYDQIIAFLYEKLTKDLSDLIKIIDNSKGDVSPYNLQRALCYIKKYYYKPIVPTARRIFDNSQGIAKALNAIINELYMLRENNKLLNSYKEKQTTIAQHNKFTLADILNLINISGMLAITILHKGEILCWWYTEQKADYNVQEIKPSYHINDFFKINPQDSPLITFELY